MTKDFIRHNTVLTELVQRLSGSGNYIHLEKEVEYFDDNHNVIGEVDVMGVRKDGRLVIYEIKENDNYKARRHAKEQLIRAYEKAHFCVAPILVYHSPQRTRRIYK